MAEWYYTTNNQQMGPVSWDELRQLASTGLLQPGDMVWKEGMVDWIKASRTEGLFSERDAPRRTENLEDRSRRRLRERDDYDDDFDDRPRRRRRAPEGMPLGAKVGIIGGSIAVGLLILVVVIVLLVRGGGGGGQVGPGQFRVTLFAGQEQSRFFRFNAGQNVRISVNSQAAFNTDVDLFVLRGNVVHGADTRISKDCFLNFIAPANDTYRIRVVNLGPGQAICDVNVQ
jgi:hypothetical protein